MGAEQGMRWDGAPGCADEGVAGAGSARAGECSRHCAACLLHCTPPPRATRPTATTYAPSFSLVQESAVGQHRGLVHDAGLAGGAGGIHRPRRCLKLLQRERGLVERCTQGGESHLRHLSSAARLCMCSSPPPYPLPSGTLPVHQHNCIAGKHWYCSAAVPTHLYVVPDVAGNVGCLVLLHQRLDVGLDVIAVCSGESKSKRRRGLWQRGRQGSRSAAGGHPIPARRPFPLGGGCMAAALPAKAPPRAAKCTAAPQPGGRGSGALKRCAAYP